MDDLVYLDNAATTFPKPEVVHEKMASFYRNYGVNPGRTGCDLALAAEEMVRGTREKLSDLFNPALKTRGIRKDPDRLVFTLNATGALNLILKGTLNPGDHVVSTWMEHNSVLRPIHHLEKAGVEADFIRPDGEGYVDPDEVRKAIRPNTRLVIVNHASNVTGAVQDIEAMGRICAEREVPFAVDTAQTAGVLPIDMETCRISFLSFTGHKGLFGPTGTGGICVADDARIEGTLWGGTGVKSAHPYHLEEYPYRLEAGTLNLSGIAGLSAGVDWVLERGLAAIHRHEIGLLSSFQEGVRDIPGLSLCGTSRLDRRVATCSVTLEGFDPSDVGTFLDVDHGIVTRTGLQCAPLVHEHMGTSPRGTVRFSFGPFNTAEHVDRAVAALRSVAALRRPKAG
ncbi:MAG: aminotransferase class V-fold PLP-dependent enzyme [Acidobacteriota bacterium]